MPAPLLLIDRDGAIQAAADVVEIGGGIVGACAALHARDQQYTRAVVSSQGSLMRFLDASRG